ncbi:hypothetical protein PCC79_11430 [Propioniciclava soli]|uniref:ATP/GTP-binding protein n=1 Tax=Propioniciclava soli TaxID=2775081 RepID=A0ABZ3C5H0_9ACTN
MVVVGYPLWLWVDGQDRLDATSSTAGIPLALHAVRERVVFAMGDGKSITCTSMSPLPSGTKPGTPSPDCGYVYEGASLPEGSYTVTASSHWSVAWSALGYSGTVPVVVSASRELPVGELQAVIVG